jgi:formamidopyrimidine-DNA glycosylase
MPELPEVETIARGLRPVLEGNRIVSARVWRPNVVVGPVRAFTRALEGRGIERVGRRAKLLHFELEGGGVWWTSLRMTGHYLLQPALAPLAGDGEDRDGPGRAGVTTPPFARGVFDLASGERLYYLDVRTLGKMGVLDRKSWEARSAELGPEPLAPSFTARELARRLAATRRRIKEVLLDQRVIAGVGNIYASEALFRAGVDPRARANRLAASAVRRLHAAIRAVLREAIAFQGTTLGVTFLNYTDSAGESGAFQERLRVYDRADESCPRCGGPVRRIVQGQRATYFCPRCQRRGRR